jgi:hypothetical protein
MSAEEQQLNEFLTWFGNLELIPLTVRRDFFAHVNQVGGIDSKSFQFIESTLERLSETTDNQVNNLKNEWSLVASTLRIQAEPRLSLKEKIIHKASQLMLWRANGFKSQYDSLSERENQAAENEATMNDQLEVNSLKASLGV